MLTNDSVLQVVALKVRSLAKLDEPDRPVDKEIDYPKVINSVLPPEIRVLGWTPVPETFDARYAGVTCNFKYPVGPSLGILFCCFWRLQQLYSFNAHPCF